MEGLSFEGPKGIVEIRPEDHVALQNMYIVTLASIDAPNSRFFELVTTNRPHPPCLLEGEYADRCGDLRPGTLLPPPPAVEEDTDS
jgi:branched-chain amino acid transport system substrate-binding protein